MENNFGKQLREIALGNNFGKLSGTILRINYFEEYYFWGVAFGNNFTNKFEES
jgi:hypothetical protein